VLHAAPAPVTPHRPPLKLVIAGHVDHGKSTLIGRLLHETGTLPAGKLEELQAVSARRGMPLEWSFALDAFQAERDQAVTIDVTQARLRLPERDIVIIDAPGHREFLRNMISGAAAADAALLVVDAAEGVREQTRRHAYLLHLLGIQQVAVAITKLDLVGYDAARFEAVRQAIVAYLAGLGLTPRAVVPISAREGDLLTGPSPRLAWYEGPALLEVLANFDGPPALASLPLRLPIQDVYKFDARRVLAGRIEAGILRVGDTLLFSPANQTARVVAIEAWPGPGPVEAHAGCSVAIRLDEPIFVERGDLASHPDRPPVLTNVFRATLFWLGRRPLAAGCQVKLKLATRVAPVVVEAVEAVIDTDSLARRPAGQVPRHGVAEVVLRCRELLALDEYRAVPATGRFVLVDGFETVAGGIISMRGYPDQRPALAPGSPNLTAVAHRVTGDARARRNRHTGGVLWLTGLPAAGKSTLAMAVEQALFQRGYQVYVLDGDNVRRGLNANLGFSPADRTENIRRVGEVAALFADAGLICITAFISPYRADRERARRAAGGNFHEVYVRADLATCERRDPKGLYRRARAGEIPDFTGVSAPYEEPEAPELVIDTTAESVDASVQRIVAYVEARFALVDPPARS
jgi:bifunctional enzyme CysN/CysC